MGPIIERKAPSGQAILGALREVYRGPAWYGPSLRSALRGVRAELALHRPGPGRNTIWEILLHLAYTRHRLILRLADAGEGRPGRFPRALRKPWWPELPEETGARAWKADRELLDAYQERLLEAVGEAPSEKLARPRLGEKRPLAREVLGCAMHDAYHAGQIRLIRLLDRDGA